MQSYTLRQATPDDLPGIVALYQAAAVEGGLARSAAEITESYIRDFLDKALAKGIVFVIHPAEDAHYIAGEIHGYPLGLKTFSHVLEQVTMAVHPEAQGLGLGKKLLQAVQQEVRQHWPHILKIELKCFSNNERALRMYQKYGFRIEGRQVNRVLIGQNQYADGISLAWFNPDFKSQ